MLYSKIILSTWSINLNPEINTFFRKYKYTIIKVITKCWGSMLNGVNISDELNSSQLKEQIGVSSVVTNPINNPYKNIDRSLLIDETAISDEALNLYKKEQEIKGFNSIAMSDPEDLSHEDIISELFNKGICDPLSDEAVESLVDNNKLLEDLNL